MVRAALSTITTAQYSSVLVEDVTDVGGVLAGTEMSAAAAATLAASSGSSIDARAWSAWFNSSVLASNTAVERPSVGGRFFVGA
jgi:hypothetical protein